MHGDVGLNIDPITKSKWFAMCVCLWYRILQAYSPGNASCSGPRTGTSCVGNCFVCIAARITCCTRQHYTYTWLLEYCLSVNQLILHSLNHCPHYLSVAIEVTQHGHSPPSFSPFNWMYILSGHLCGSCSCAELHCDLFPAKHAASGASPNGNNGSRAPQFS